MGSRFRFSGHLNEIVDNGAGNLPAGWFYSGGHSNSLIPFYAKGVSSVWFNVFADEVDPVRGPYIDNTEIADVIFGYYDESFPIELSSFDVIVSGGHIVVNWATASEKDNERFEIERNGMLVASVGSTNAAAGDVYEWTDDIIPLGSSGANRYMDVSHYERFRPELEALLKFFTQWPHIPIRFSIE